MQPYKYIYNAFCEVFVFLVSAAENEHIYRLRACSINLPRLVFSSRLLLNLLHHALYEVLMVISFKQSFFASFSVLSAIA
jgi:hypothetical protein